MAIYFLRSQHVSRANGSRVTRAAAYRSGERIRDERTSEVYDHSGREDVAHKEVVVPEDLANRADMAWTQDRATLWNAAEVCFPFLSSRGSEHVRTVLGLMPGANRVLLTDGYAAYEKYAKKLEIAHAQCWVHCRRGFFEALQADPEVVEEALKQIATLYKIEDQIRDQNLSGKGKRQHRLTHSKPRVEAFLAWIDRQFERQGLLPSNPFTQALGYARERRLGLEVFLEDPDVAMDTNHLERALRVIPMGRRNWLTWTELGAKHVGIVQSLITTCRPYEINPYDYLVDRVGELTPRVWRQRFSTAPLRSDLGSGTHATAA